VAQGLIDSIGKIVDLKTQGILNSLNGIDIDIDMNIYIDQRREYVKVYCQSYHGRMLKADGWDKPSPTENLDSKLIDRLLRLPPKSFLLQSEQLMAVPNTNPCERNRSQRRRRLLSILLFKRRSPDHCCTH
jgi:hypothetical protein